MSAIPTQEEFLENLYARRDDVIVLLKAARASGDKEATTSYRAMVAKYEKLIVNAGGHLDA